jgi:hypothetical protein
VPSWFKIKKKIPHNGGIYNKSLKVIIQLPEEA